MKDSISSKPAIKRFPEYRRTRFDPFDAPTKRQFAYAVALCINMSKMDFHNVSEAIDKAKKTNKRKISQKDSDEIYDYIVSQTPISREDRYQFKQMHVVLPRGAKAYHGDAIEEFLEDDKQFVFMCPFCKKTLVYDDWLAGFMLDNRCPKCRKSWASFFIKIEYASKDPLLFIANFVVDSSIVYQCTQPSIDDLKSKSNLEFEAHLMGGEYYSAHKIVMFKNKWRKAFNIDFRPIVFEFEPSNQYDRNAIKIIDKENGKTIGYVDRRSAAQIARFYPCNLNGHIKEIQGNSVILFIEIIQK